MEVFALKNLENFYSGFLVLATFLVFLGHWLACLFIYLQNLKLEAPFQSYVNSMYFIFMTSSTVGYGDSDLGIEAGAEPRGDRHYLVISLYIFLLQVFFCYLQMTLLFMFTEWHKIYYSHETTSEDLSDWIARINRVKACKWSFEEKIRHFFKFLHVWDVDNTVKTEFYRRLDTQGKQAVSDYIGKKIAEDFRFFDDFSEINKSDLAFSSKVFK